MLRDFAMVDDESFAYVILEYIERSVRGMSRLFRTMISRITSSEQVSEQLAALASKLEDNSRILQEIKENTDSKIFDTPVIQSRDVWSPSCISLSNHSSDGFVLDPLLDP